MSGHSEDGDDTSFVVEETNERKLTARVDDMISIIHPEETSERMLAPLLRCTLGFKTVMYLFHKSANESTLPLKDNLVCTLTSSGEVFRYPLPALVANLL